MQKSVFTPLYDAFRQRLAEMRRTAGLTQRQLAARLRRPRSFISRIEDGERRVDIVELFWICREFGLAPAKIMATLAKEFEALESPGAVQRAAKRPHRPKSKRG